MKYTRYEDVPWNRKSSFNSLLLITGIFLGIPMWWCCLNLLTGDVYYNGYDSNGSLRTWPKSNKIVAAIWSVLALIMIIYILVSL